jgi:hypothetical protein
MKTKDDVKFDPDDAHLFENVRVRYHGSNWYAVVPIGKGRLAHRLIMDATETHETVDHINGDTLDNRRANLRIVTKAENGANRVKPHACNTSGYRGVSYDKFSGKWAAYVSPNYSKKHLGRYVDPVFAAAVAATWRALYMPGARK